MIAPFFRLPGIDIALSIPHSKNMKYDYRRQKAE